MFTMVRSSRRAIVVLLAILGLSLVMGQFVMGQAGTAAYGAVMDPPTDDPGTGGPSPSAVPTPPIGMIMLLPTPSDGGQGGSDPGASPGISGIIIPEPGDIRPATPTPEISDPGLDLAGLAPEASSPAPSSGGTQQNMRLVAVAIGSSTLTATLTALALIGWWRRRRTVANRRPAPAPAPVAPAGPDWSTAARPDQSARGWGPVNTERPVRRPTVIKDEPYRPRHRLPRG